MRVVVGIGAKAVYAGLAFRLATTCPIGQWQAQRGRAHHGWVRVRKICKSREQVALLW